MSTPNGIGHIVAIKPLTYAERAAIAQALQAYVAANGERAFAQKIILEEMLYELMWCQLAPTKAVERYEQERGER